MKTKADMEMMAHGWASMEESQRKKHCNTIRICLFSPFLFGKSYVSNDWLEWMQHAGFLKSAKRLEIKCFDDSLFFAMDILEKTFEALHKQMEKPIFFYSCMSVIEEIDSLAHKPEDCIRIGKGESTFCDFFNDEGDTFEKKMALLYSAKSYIEYVYYVVKLGKCRLKELTPNAHSQKRIQSYKGIGNTKFQECLYTKAITSYTKALQLDPYNHILYGNRAQTYLKTDKFQEALWDGRRALVLEPNWAKGFYRYAQAFFELNFLDRALHENYLGFEFADEPSERRDLSMQMKKFYDFKNDLGSKKKPDDDDVPDLVEQGGSSDSDGSDSDCMPDLVSDGLDSFSDDASESEFIEQSSGRLIEIRKKRLLRERKSFEERMHKTEKKQKGKRDTPAFNIQLLNNSSSSSKGPGIQLKVELRRNKPVPVSNATPIPCPKPEHVEMMKELTLGSNSHLENMGREALTQYQKVIKYIRDSTVKYGGMNEDDYVGFTYCYAHICLNSGIPDEIQKSEQLFCGILKDHASIFFPLAYYGIGCYYQRLNRFSEAIEQLQKGEKSLNESPELQPLVYWPGTNKQVKESVADNIFELFEELIHDCKNPPKPLALCSIVGCAYIKRDIYPTDMDFKGYVHIVCTEDCRLDYHINCWKAWKVEFYNRTHEKDILNKECSTPDCLGIICTISTYGHDGCIRSEAKVEPSCKSKQKAAQPSQPALSKSKKKRQKKKQKKHSEEEEQPTSIPEPTIESTESHVIKPKDTKPKKEPMTTPPVVEETKENVEKIEKKNEEIKTEEIKKEESKLEEVVEKQVDYEFVLKKDDIEDVQPTKASKKKKQKSKKALSDFQIKFSGDEDRRFWGHEDADENGYIEYNKYMSPITNVEPGVYPAALGPPPGDPKAYDKFAENMDEIVFMLYSYFHAILEKEGPLPVNSELLLEDFKTFPFEAHLIVEAAGGLAQFLLKSLKFAMFEDHICLLKHAVRCKEILARKHGRPIDSELKASKQHQQSQEHPSADFQPLLTPFALSPLCQSLKKKVLKRSFNGLDVVDDIQINDNGSDEDKASELSDVYSTASETDHNEAVDQDDCSITTEEDDIGGLKNSDGSQESKQNLDSVDGSPKKTVIDDFRGDEEYIDDDILGKELELERYMMEGSSVDAPTLTNEVIDAISDSPDASSADSSEPTLLPPSDTQKSVDSGIGTVSPDDLMTRSFDLPSKQEVDIKFKLSEDSSSTLPQEIIEGFCLNKPTPYSEIKPKVEETISTTPEVSEEKRSAAADEKYLEQEKMWDQALDLLGSLNDNFEWFTMEPPPSIDPDSTTEDIGDIIQIPACLWEMAIGSIEKIRDHCLEIQKKKSHMKSKFVQCIPKTKNVCLITTPYEPYKQELLEMKTKNNQIKESLKDTMSKYTHLQQSSGVESARLKEEIKKIQAQSEDLSKKMNDKASAAEQQQKKLQSELAHIVREAKAKDDKLKTLDDDLIKMTTEMSKVSQKMNHFQQERDKHFAEQNKLKESVETSSRSFQGLKNRAEQSEIKVLRMMCHNQCKTLIDVIKEAERNRDRLVNTDESENIDAIQTWEATVTVNTKKVRDLKNNYDVMIQNVVSGTPLESMPPITDVLPYWPPPKPLKPTKKPVSSGSDATQASVPQVHPNPTAAQPTPVAVPTNPANQQQSWLIAQQNEAKRREASKMAANPHQPMNYGQNQQRPQYQSNLPPRMAFVHGRQMPPKAYINGTDRPALNPHGVPPQEGPHSVPHAVPHAGISSTSGAGSQSVQHQPAAVSVANPHQAVAHSSMPPKASTLKQANSLGAVAGHKVSGRVIPPAPAHLKNSFDKLTYQLGEMFNHQYTKGQLAMFLKEVRTANGGSLSGLPSKDIIDRVVKTILKREEEHPVNKPAKASYPKKIPPGMGMNRDSGLNTWKTMPIRHSRPLNLEEEDPCVICHEEMPMKPVSKLECQHIFHTDCIQRWMNEQKTCPTCREFVLLPDDYPTL